VNGAGGHACDNICQLDSAEPVSEGFRCCWLRDQGERTSPGGAPSTNDETIPFVDDMAGNLGGRDLQIGKGAV
jgi:hypothetical protein